MNMRFKLCILVLFMVTCAHAQNPNKLIRQGNNAYADSSYATAEKSYREALSTNQDAFNAAFNLADAIYKQGNYEESSALFQGLTAKAESKKEKSMAYHNLGNSLLKEQKLDESIESYKNALRNNPYDHETKYNLAFAQRMKQLQESQQEQEQEQEQKSQEQESQEQESQEQESQEQESQEEQKPQKEQNPNQISKEEAEKMLDALQQQEKELQEDLQKKKGKGLKLKIEKDW